MKPSHSLTFKVSPGSRLLKSHGQDRDKDIASAQLFEMLWWKTFSSSSSFFFFFLFSFFSLCLSIAYPTGLLSPVLYIQSSSYRSRCLFTHTVLFEFILFLWNVDFFRFTNRNYVHLFSFFSPFKGLKSVVLLVKVSLWKLTPTSRCHGVSKRS